MGERRNLINEVTDCSDSAPTLLRLCSDSAPTLLRLFFTHDFLLFSYMIGAAEQSAKSRRRVEANDRWVFHVSWVGDEPHRQHTYCSAMMIFGLCVPPVQFRPVRLPRLRPVQFSPVQSSARPRPFSFRPSSACAFCCFVQFRCCVRFEVCSIICRFAQSKESSRVGEHSIPSASWTQLAR